MAELKKIKIFVEEKTSSDGSGRKFNVYRALTKNGVKITAKFRKEVKELPKEDCFAFIFTNNMNMQRNSEYPTLWISDVERYEAITVTVDEEANAREINEIFG